MINDYKKYVECLNLHKFIFAPNSSGKIMLAESLQGNVQTKRQHYLFNKDSFASILKNEKRIQKPIKNFNDDWSLTIDQKERNAFLDDKDLQFIIAIIDIKISNVRIENTNTNKIYLKNLVIKKGNKKIPIIKIDELKNETSSSEYELITLIIFILGLYNLEITIIIDDPIELASWENERIFIAFLSYLFKKQKKSKMILLTHRISLYKKLIGLHKVAKINGTKPIYFYFIDEIPFWINPYDSIFLDLFMKEGVIKQNIIYKRIYLENIYKRFFFKKFLHPKMSSMKILMVAIRKSF